MKKIPWWLTELRAMRACKEGLRPIEECTDFGQALTRSASYNLEWLFARLGLGCSWYPAQLDGETDFAFEERLRQWALGYRYKLADLLKQKRKIRLLKLQLKKLKARRR